MDTQQSIATLQALKNTLDSNALGFKAQSDSIQVSIDQLNGVLITQADNLRAEFQQTIDNQAQDIIIKDLKIKDLQAQVDILLQTPAGDPVVDPVSDITP